MGKHTKGPWAIDCAHDDNDKPGRNIYVATHDLQTVITKCDDSDDGEANAALIAAAPELLAAVKKAYSMTAPLATYGRELAALIAKAEGR